jgi:DUF1365 family protein
MKRLEISRSRLGQLLFTRVPMPAKVLGGIHLEAARTWIAGARYHPHPGGLEKRDLPKRPEDEMLCPVEASGRTGTGDGRERSGH